MQPYIEIILGTGQPSKGVEDPQAARLQELVDYVQAQVSLEQSKGFEFFSSFTFLHVLQCVSWSRCVQFPKCTNQSVILPCLIAVIWMQGGSAGSDILEGPSVSIECILEDLDMRIRRLEKWNMVHTVGAKSTPFDTSELISYS